MSRTPYDVTADSAGRVALFPTRAHVATTLVALAGALRTAQLRGVLVTLTDAVNHLDHPQRHSTAEVIEFYEHQRDEAVGVLVGDHRVQFALGHLLDAPDALTLAVEILQAGEIQPAIDDDSDEQARRLIGYWHKRADAARKTNDNDSDLLAAAWETAANELAAALAGDLAHFSPEEHTHQHAQHTARTLGVIEGHS